LMPMAPSTRGESLFESNTKFSKELSTMHKDAMLGGISPTWPRASFARNVVAWNANGAITEESCPWNDTR
jgi:hypothetical protein